MEAALGQCHLLFNKYLPGAGGCAEFCLKPRCPLLGLSLTSFSDGEVEAWRDSVPAPGHTAALCPCLLGSRPWAGGFPE